ncbi:unnamed protein product [Brassica rapa subsp. trilocularis]
MNKRKQKTHRKLYLKINDSTTPKTGERRLRKLSQTVRSPQLKRLESGPLDLGPQNGFSGFFTEHHAVHADARRGGQLRNRGGSLLRDPARNKFGSAEGSSKKLPTFFSPRNQQ